MLSHLAQQRALVKHAGPPRNEGRRSCLELLFPDHDQSASEAANGSVRGALRSRPGTHEPGAPKVLAACCSKRLSRLFATTSVGRTMMRECKSK